MQSKSRRADVLVIEDDTDIRGVFREFLALEGYRVRVAADGQEALALLAQALPTVILTDLNMPNMDGWEFLTALRADPVRKHIPVVIMTAEENFPTGYPVLKKPFRMDAVLRFLEASCSTMSAEDATEDSSTASSNDRED